MKRSSSPSSDPFGYLVARGPIADATSPTAWLQAMLDVEAALTVAQGVFGEVPGDAGSAIVTACRADQHDADAVFADAERGLVPVVGLVQRIREAVGADAAEFVHRGATSQDIMDTAAMTIVRRCSLLAAHGLERGAAIVQALEDEHGDQPIIGRTLGQYAVATTLRTVTARWRTALGDARGVIGSLALDLPVQLGGPVGDRASYGPNADAIADDVANRLGLVVPPRPWPTQRAPIARIAGAFGLAAASVSGVATQLVMLTASDVGELTERAEGAGGSSSMPHKHNPVAAIAARAAALQVPGHVATLLHAAGGHEFERAAGSWQAEWPALNAMLRATGSAVEWLVTSLQRVTVLPERMATNVARAESERAGE